MMRIVFLRSLLIDYANTSLSAIQGAAAARKRVRGTWGGAEMAALSSPAAPLSAHVGLEGGRNGNRAALQAGSIK